MSAPLVVIGSNSFSGSHFVDGALAEGLEVIGISRSPEPLPVFLPYRRHGPGRFRFHQLDLNLHTAEILAVLDEARAEHVVNFAAQSMVAESWAHPEHWFQTNVAATMRLIEGLRTRSFLRRYVHVSTPEVYGHCSGLVPESAVYAPSTPYAVSRAAADLGLAAYHKAYGFPVVFTRAANVYGPGQQLYRIIPRALLCFLTGRRLPLHGGGRSVRSFIHIRDVVAGTLAAMRQGVPGEVYHLATLETIAIRDLVQRLADLVGVPFESAVEVTGDRLGKDAAYRLDTTKARTALGWADRVPLDTGLAEVLAWVRDNLATLRDLPWDYQHKP